MERLVFNGTSKSDAPAISGNRVVAADARRHEPPALSISAPREERDWAFIGLMLFTALLFLRPQDVFTPLRALHLAELSALFALGSLVFTRLGRGLPATRFTPELGGVLAFAAVILLTAPFSFWMGGAIGTFTELYVKVVLIFVLMVNTLTTPRRVVQFTWLLVLASGYIGGRAALDYLRGVHLVENGRVQGAVGGMFRNPNDLALNMVAILPLAIFLAMRPLPLVRRGVAALCAVLMLFAIVASQSRSGTVGLAAMIVVLCVVTVQRKPGVVFAMVFAGMLAVPLLPASYRERLASITNKDLDQTGSREARSILLQESFDTFVAHPMTGVGAGQFKNYNPDGRQEAWRESHNVVLQVASELGIFGLLVFGFLLFRGLYAPLQTRRLLRRARAPSRGSAGASAPPLEPDVQDLLSLHAATMSAALVGWFVCALFASVAYHWTFYYLLALAVMPRDYLVGRLTTDKQARRAAAARAVVTAGAHG
jgi:putative inorganic carbon (hco3(-)) transporter